MRRVSPQGGSLPGGSASPGAHSPAGSTGCWIGTGCTPGPSHPSGRCVSHPTGPGRRCWWCPRYPSPGCCLDPASHRHPEAPSGTAAETTVKTGERKVEHDAQISRSHLCALLSLHCLPLFSIWMSKMNNVSLAFRTQYGRVCIKMFCYSYTNTEILWPLSIRNSKTLVPLGIWLSVRCGHLL